MTQTGHTGRAIITSILAWIASLTLFTLAWTAAFTVLILLPVLLLTR